MNLVKPNHNAEALILTTRLTKENADENNSEYEHFLRSDEKLMATNAYLSISYSFFRAILSVVLKDSLMESHW